MCVKQAYWLTKFLFSGNKTGKNLNLGITKSCQRPKSQIKASKLFQQFTERCKKDVWESFSWGNTCTSWTYFREKKVNIPNCLYRFSDLQLHMDIVHTFGLYLLRCFGIEAMCWHTFSTPWMGSSKRTQDRI